MTYKFTQFDVEIVNPTIEIKTDSIIIYPNLMQIEVDLVMTVADCRFGIRLTEINVQNLIYDSQSLELRVMERLNDFVI